MPIQYRTERVNIALEPSLMLILRTVAEQEKTEMSPYVRGLMIDDFVRRGLLDAEQLHALSSWVK
jgi:hypothetical protein